MTGFLIDTSTLSYLIDDTMPQHPAVSARFAASDTSLLVSILTVYEIALLDHESADAAQRFVRTEFSITPVPPEGADGFVRLKRGLADRWGVSPKKLGRHNIDLMIASTALTLDLVLVSGDAIFRDLAAIEPRLFVEDWTL